MLLWTFVFISLEYIHLGMKLLSYSNFVELFWGIAKLSHNSCAIFHVHQQYIKTQFPHILVNICYFQFLKVITISVDVRWYLIIVLIFYFSIEWWAFMCLFALSIYLPIHPTYVSIYLCCYCSVAKWKEVKVSQSCLTLCDPMDYTVRGILQARILEWVPVPFCRGSSQPRDQTQASHIAGRFFASWASS